MRPRPLRRSWVGVSGLAGAAVRMPAICGSRCAFLGEDLVTTALCTAARWLYGGRVTAALHPHPLGPAGCCVPTTAPAGPARASTAARPRAASGMGPSGQVSSDDEPSPVRVAVGGALDPLETYSATQKL
jgi:hypothetical protein